MVCDDGGRCFWGVEGERRTKCHRNGTKHASILVVMKEVMVAIKEAMVTQVNSLVNQRQQSGLCN